ncbi:MAG: PspC domain-containing protein [Acidimicrobiales bacterium]
MTYEPIDPTDPIDPADLSADLAAGAATTDTLVGEAPATASYDPTPPPPFVPERNQLARDPCAAFGGVASGLAYRLGMNVAVVRLIVLLVFIFTGGIAIPLYLIAWLVLPRALVWPPHSGIAVPPRTSRRGVGFLGFVVAGILALTTLVAIPVTIVAVGAALTSDGVTVAVGNDEFRLGIYSPNTLDELPAVIDTDEGFIKVDLSDIPRSEFADRTEPVTLTIDVRDGEVQLKIPEGLSYSLGAITDDGTLKTSGVDPSARQTTSAILVEADNPDIIISVRIGRGDVDIEMV